MNADRPMNHTKRFEVRPTSDSHFSWLRTRMSADRTLMSYVRTGVSLIGIGFTIFQFFERFSGMQGVAPAARPEAHRYLGLALIAAETTSLMIAACEYRSLVRYLWSNEYEAIAGVGGTPSHTPAPAVTILLTLIGIFAFGGVLVRAL